MAFTRRNLPHISIPEADYFITYRQKDTWDGVSTLKVEPVLSRPEIASIIMNSWHDLSNKILLHAVCIMNDHVHVVLKTMPEISLSAVLASHKKFTARRINQILGRQGYFWLEESFDKIVWEDAMVAAIQYTLLNPVKSGYVEDWRDWPNTYLSPEKSWVAGLMQL